MAGWLAGWLAGYSYEHCPFRFERLKLKCLQEPLTAKYMEIINKFSAEIDKVQKLYQEQHLNPPLAKNMPPISGSILWSRQMVHHLQEPMDMLKGVADLQHTPQWKGVVKKYNKIATILVEYEILQHQHWAEVITLGHNALQVRPLISACVLWASQSGLTGSIADSK